MGPTGLHSGLLLIIETCQKDLMPLEEKKSPLIPQECSVPAKISSSASIARLVALPLLEKLTTLFENCLDDLGAYDHVRIKFFNSPFLSSGFGSRRDFSTSQPPYSSCERSHAVLVSFIGKAIFDHVKDIEDLSFAKSKSLHLLCFLFGDTACITAHTLFRENSKDQYLTEV